MTKPLDVLSQNCWRSAHAFRLCQLSWRRSGRKFRLLLTMKLCFVKYSIILFRELKRSSSDITRQLTVWLGVYPCSRFD